MERFSCGQPGLSLDSDVGDRYGFESPTSFNSRLDSSDWKPSLKIRVSSNGRVEEKVVTPQPNRDAPITLKTFERAIEETLTLPGLAKYKDFGQALLKTLHQNEIRPSQQPRLVTSSDYTRAKPYFQGCPPDPRNVTTCNGCTVYISLYVTPEMQANNPTEIVPFSRDGYNLPQREIVFTISQEDDFLGRLCGQTIVRDGYPRIRVRYLENFARDRVSWKNFPIGANIVASFNIEGCTAYTSHSPRSSDLPTNLPTNLPTEHRQVLTPIPHKYYAEGETQKSNSTITPLTKPFFQGHPPSPENYAKLDTGVFGAYLKLVQVPPPSFEIPLFGFDQDLVLSLLRDEETLAQGRVKINPQGVGTLPTIEGVTWESVTGIKLCLEQTV